MNLDACGVASFFLRDWPSLAATHVNRVALHGSGFVTEVDATKQAIEVGDFRDPIGLGDRRQPDDSARSSWPVTITHGP
jgi:hypothetical protein